MNVQEQIKEYLASQPEPKRGEMQALHDIILQNFSDLGIVREFEQLHAFELMGSFDDVTTASQTKNEVDSSLCGKR